MKRIFILIALLLILLYVGMASGQFKVDLGTLGKYFSFPQKAAEISLPSEKVKIVNEESVVIDVVEKTSNSVVTISIVKSRPIGRIFEIDPFDPFNIFRQRGQSGSQKIEQDIGTGFIISEDGMIATNRHVVADTNAKYKVITKDDKTYEAEKIYRDPVNDLAIIKINAKNLKPVTLGDSSKLKVGQMVIAIGTALGEFRHTVTVGVISGLGRGITAGSPFEGYVEKLDDVIQTDAAINPGNSGGPLLNSSGQVIGINTAVSQEGQNIGFAIPINVIKDAITQFNQNGKFQRPYLGVSYKMITRDLAILNDVPEGAYVQDVIENSPAKKAGIKEEDIITKIDGVKVTEKEGGLAKIISGKKIGDKVTVEVWRDGETKTLEAIIGENKEE